MTPPIIDVFDTPYNQRFSRISNRINMESASHKYYHAHKQRIKDSKKFRQQLRDIKIDSLILEYSPNFFEFTRYKRRGILHSILEGEFDIHAAWIQNSYIDFVKKFNESALEHGINTTDLINRHDKEPDEK